jgi:hypothetical protein
VIADDLVQLDEFRAVLLEPIPEPLVQFGPRRLRQRHVGGVADEEVAETIGVLAGELRLVRADELLANERAQPDCDLRLLRGKRLHSALVEDPALDRATLKHPALGRL